MTENQTLGSPTLFLISNCKWMRIADYTACHVKAQLYELEKMLLFALSDEIVVSSLLPHGTAKYHFYKQILLYPKIALLREVAMLYLLETTLFISELPS